MHTLPYFAEEVPKCMGRTSFYSPSGLPRGHPPSKQRKCLPGAGSPGSPGRSRRSRKSSLRSLGNSIHSNFFW